MLDGHSTNDSEMQHNGMEGIKPGHYIKNQQDATLAVLFISHCKIARLQRSGNRPWTSLLDICHPDPWHAPVAATTVLVLLMMDAESVRNM